ncbi:MAG: hypothetical protein HAW61_01635, partial [Candidatus Portiera sp.]|nr:hypothetical protein [Portiera sp.]
ELFSDIFSDVPQELPAEEINLPPPVPKSTKCYELSGYATSATALNDLRILDTYGIKSKMLSKEPEEDTNRYRILVKVRASLDTAKKLSDLLSGSRIPNTIQEQTTLGSLLVTNFYASRKQAEQVNKKIRNLGFSSDIEASSKKTASKNTAGEKSYNLIIDQNEAVSWEKSRRDLIDLLNSKVKISELPRC